MRLNHSIIFAATSLAIATHQMPAYAASANQSQAVAIARAGGFDAALPELERFVQQNPQNLRYRYDWVTVLSWAGRHDQAILESQSIKQGKDVPTYVLMAIGKSSLSATTKDTKRALATYGAIVKREPANADARLGLALAQLEDHQLNAADQNYTTTLALAQQSPKILGAAIDALMARHEAERAEPFRRRLMSLEGAPATLPQTLPSVPENARETNVQVALDTAEANAIDAEKLADFSRRQELNAQHIRAAEKRLDQDFGINRYQLIDAAIAENERLISEANTLQAKDTLLRLRKDRVVALRDRQRAAEALAEFEALDAEDVTLPPYVVNAAADAAMQLRQPLRGRDFYLRSLQQDEGNLGTRTSLMYAHLEAENFASSENVLQDLMTQTQNAAGTRRTQATIMRFADRLEEADAATQALMTELPKDAGIWLARADLLAARGLPRAAAKLYTQVLTVEPTHIGARVGLANATWAQGDIAGAAEMVKTLEAEAPEHPAVRRLKNDWQRRQRPLFVTTVTQGYGQGRVSGNDDMTWESVLYSGQTDLGLRVFATQHLAHAQFNGDSAQHERLGAGIEFTQKDIQATLELGKDQRNGRDTVWAAGVGWQANDHISARVRYESETNDFPLKGRLPNAEDWAPTYLYASKAVAGVAYTWNESRKVAADLAYYDFNDGNKRKALSVAWTERLYSGYGRTVDLQTAAYTSTNSAQDAIYFNPKKDIALSATLSGDWQLWREYERSFNHRLAATLGLYRQTSNVRTNNTWGETTYGWNNFYDYRYEHEWRWGQDRSTRYGIGVRRFPYDGQYETKGYLYLQLTWRF
ncbi:poly-beta-1,6 N-acetyl-D-glucosamine export porin PgaA [Variovorax sp. HJSM1_2]|uniref:poly-beta-1,6 N-acetyl-D-glucosamine export porin PgaA n=1 Tax=Variovorax sp. HJSM1_2 TaxID=3366263 RepID=UPI003BCA5C48